MRMNDGLSISHAISTRLTRYVGAGLLLLAGIAPAFGATPKLCSFYNGESVHQRLTEDCCSSVGLTCNAPPTGVTTLNSVVMIVADDNSYCNWSFMGGLCTSSSLGGCQPGTCSGAEVCSYGKCILPCDSNAACTANDSDTCVSSEEFQRIKPELGTPPLRLNDPSCRNRQARRGDSNHCPLTTDGRRLENGEFKYSRDAAPCERNTAADDPHVLTPFVDEIANRAAVFPRAHVSG